MKYIKPLRESATIDYKTTLSIIIKLQLATAIITFARQIYSNSRLIGNLDDRVYDEELTQEIKKITKDNRVYVYSIEASVVNAFVTTEYGSLFYTDKLKDLLTYKELIAVMLHEYNHDINEHPKKKGGIIFSSTLSAIIFDMGLTEVLKGENTPGLKGASLAFLHFYTLLSILRLPVYFSGRSWEYSSDSYAAKKGYGKELISALTKLHSYVNPNVKKNTKWNKVKIILSKVSDIFSKVLLFSFDEHPNLDERIKNIINTKEYKKAEKEAVENINLSKIKIK